MRIEVQDSQHKHIGKYEFRVMPRIGETVKLELTHTVISVLHDLDRDCVVIVVKQSASPDLDSTEKANG